MKIMSSRLKGLTLGVTAILAATAVIPIAIAAALPPGTPRAGTVSISPATGTSATTFSVVPPVGAACPGDNTQSYLYHSFITPFGNDPADMVYTPSGTPTGEPQFTNNLANSVGTRSRNLLPGLGDGLLIAVSNQSYASTALFGTLTPGTYTVGITCTQPDGAFVPQTMRYWATEITIAASAGSGPNNFTYAVGNAPPPTTTTTVPPTTTTTTTTTTVPPTTTTTVPPTTTTTTTTVPPRPGPRSPYDVTCSGGALHRVTTGVLLTPRGPRWLPKIAVLIPARGRALVGVISSKEVRDQSGDNDDDASYGSTSDRGFSNGKHSSRRITTCVTDPYTNGSGGTSVIEFKIRFA